VLTGTVAGEASKAHARQCAEARVSTGMQPDVQWDRQGLLCARFTRTPANRESSIARGCKPGLYAAHEPGRRLNHWLVADHDLLRATTAWQASSAVAAPASMTQADRCAEHQGLLHGTGR